MTPGLPSTCLTAEVQIDAGLHRCTDEETYRGREDRVNGSQGYRGIGFHTGSQRRERKPGAESKLCGQTLTGALGKISASSGAHASLLELHRSATHPRVPQMATCGVLVHKF